MEPTRLRLGELLVDARIITPEQLAEVLEVQKEDGRRLGILLVERGLVNETQLTQILSQQLSVPWVSLYHVDFSKRLLSMVPRDVASKYCLVPIYVRHVRGQGDTLYVAMYDPTNVEALRICAAWSGLPTRAMIASPSDIRNAIDVYYGPAPEGESAEQQPPEAEQAPAAQAPQPPEQPQSLAPSPVSQPEPAYEPSAAVPPDQVSAQEPAAPADQVMPTEPEQPAARIEEPLAEAPQPASVEAPAGQFEQAEEPPPAEPAVPEPEPGERDRRYDDSVSIEVGNEVALEELLRKRTAPEPVAAAPEQPSDAPRTKSGKMLALTLLDGTTLALPVSPQAKKLRRESLIKALRSPEGEVAPAQPPARPAAQPPPAAQPSTRPPPQELPPSVAGLTGRDVVAALRAAAHGVDPGDILGSSARWESVVAAVLSLMLRKGIITDEELAEELKKI